MKDLVSFRKGLNITKEDLVEIGIPVISYGQIHSKQNTGTGINASLMRYVPESYLASNQDCLVKKNDFLFADTSEDYEGCGNCVYVDKELKLFAGYHTIIASSKDDTDKRFLAYQMLTDAWRSQIRSKVWGIKVFSINRSHLANSYIIMPPLYEQKRIVEYLDHKCDDIDNVLEKTRTSINEYRKLKLSVISEAVTNGVRGPRPMKDCGIEWIGEIPESWRVARLKQVTTKIADGTHFSPETTDEGFPYITAKDVHGLGIDYKNAEKVSADSYLSLVKSGCRPEREDVLLVKDGATTGRVGMITDDTPCVLLSSVAMLHGNEILDPFFLYYFMQSNSMQEQIIISMAGSAMPRTTLTKIADYFICLPAIEEQQEIAKYLDQNCSEIDSLISSKEKFITELESYKKSLIYEYVTGKRTIIE